MEVINKDAFSLLCKEYGYNDLIELVFPIPEEGNITCRERIGIILNSPIYGSVSFFSEEENVLAIAEFLDFLRSVGHEIEMKGDIMIPRHGEIQNTEKKYTFNNDFLKNRLLSYLSDLLQEETIGKRIFDEYPEDQLQGKIRIHKEKANHKENIPKSAEEGAKFWRVYNILWEANLFHVEGKFLQKEYCFICDCARLAGWEFNNIDQLILKEGYTSKIGRKKAEYVRNRMNAYFKFEEYEDLKLGK